MQLGLSDLYICMIVFYPPKVNPGALLQHQKQMERSQREGFDNIVESC